MKPSIKIVTDSLPTKQAFFIDFRFTSRWYQNAVSLLSHFHELNFTSQYPSTKPATYKRYFCYFSQDETASERKPPPFARSQKITEPEDNMGVSFHGGYFWGIFLQDWLFYAGRHSDKQPFLGPYVQWTHLMHGPEKNRSKNNDTPRFITVYDTINNGAKYPGGYFERASYKTTRVCRTPSSKMS